jgi:MFS family permease
LVWFGQLISLVGSGMTTFALAVWIFDHTGQATPFALAALAATLPRILISPFAGVLADRINRRRVMILADSGSALVTLAAFLLLRGGGLQVWHIYVINAVAAVFGGFQEPAYAAAIPLLVPKSELSRANGLVQLSAAMDLLVSPILAGALFGSLGLAGIIRIDLITFLFALVTLLAVRIPDLAESAGEAARGDTVWSDATFGWRYLRLRPGLFRLLLFFALVNYLLNTAGVLTGPLVLSFAGPSTLGAVQSVVGVGMLAGSVLASSWRGPSRKIDLILGTIAVAGVGLLVAGLRPSPAVVASGMFILLFVVPLASAASQAIFQSKVEPALQGRVFAIRSMIARSMTPLAFLTAGPLADQVFEPLMRAPQSGVLAGLASVIGAGAGRGIGLMFSLAGVLLLLVTAVVQRDPRIRRVEVELPDVLPARPEGVPSTEGARPSTATL